MATKLPKERTSFTPQQIDFAMRFYVPTSATYSNAYASAKAALYSESQAKNITARDYVWVESIYAEICGKPTDKKNLVAKARNILAKALDDDDLRLAQDTAKFIAKTDPEFSEKLDMTSGGDSINPYNNLTTEELRKLVGK